MKKSKLLVMALAIALLLTSAFCIISAADEEATTKPEIISKNIAYEGNFALLIAIDADTVTSGSVTVEVFDEDATTRLGVYTSETTETITTAGVETEVYVVKTAGIAAKNMAKQYYFRAIDGTNVGDLDRYSVGEYFYERTYLCESTPSQLELYDYSLKMGAAAQKVLVNEKDEDTTNDETLVTDYSLVKITGGLLSDGYAQGIYANGTELTLVPASGTEAWKITDLSDESYTATDSNTLIVSNHVSIEKGELEFKLGSGIYYNGTAEGSENFNAVIYDYDSGAVSDYAANDLWNSSNPITVSLKSDENSNGILSIQRTYTGSSGVSVYGKQVISDTHVFESDIRFAAGATTTSTSNNDLRLGYIGLYSGTTAGVARPDCQPALLYLTAVTGDAVEDSEDGAKYITQVNIGYDQNSKYATFDVGEWYNLRIVIHRDSETSAFTADIYINNVAVATGKTLKSADNSSGVGGTPDVSGKINGFGYLAQGNSCMDIQLDNTFIGGYEEPYQKGDASLYYNDPGDYVGTKHTFTTSEDLFANGASAAATYTTVADGELTDKWGETYHRYNLTSTTGIAGNTHVFETDIYFDAEAATKITNSDPTFAYIGLANAYNSSNSGMFMRLYINPCVDSDNNVVAIGISNTGSKTFTESDSARYGKLELGKWYNIRIEMTINATDGSSSTNVYINGVLAVEGAASPCPGSSYLDSTAGIYTDIESFAIEARSVSDKPITVKFANMFYGTIPTETVSE